MKLLVNLATSSEPRDRYTLAWAVPVTLGAAALLMYFSVSAAHGFRDYRRYHRSLLEFRGQETRWSENQKTLRQDLDRPQYQKAFREAKFVNALIDQKEFSLAEFLVKVTKLLPPAVRLEGLTFSPGAGDRVVRLSVVGKTQDAVETFVSNLEDSADFRDVIVSSPGLAGSGGEATVTCTAVYAGGAR